MVAKTLVSRDIDGGHELVDRLRERMKVTAAYWLYQPDDETWRLVIATPTWDSEGPRGTYAIIQAALEDVTESNRPSLSDISAVSPKDATARALRRMIRSGPDPSDARITRSVFDGVYIDDALVYLSN